MQKLDYVLHRYSTEQYCTLGLLHEQRADGSLRFLTYTLEDEKRDIKVMGQTRIPAGTYQMKLRTEGGMHQRYTTRFKGHAGMLWLQDVPGFEWIYIHPGNDHTHTEGCILVGNGVRENLTRNGMLTESVPAYERVYAEMAGWLLNGGGVSITIKDIA